MCKEPEAPLGGTPTSEGALLSRVMEYAVGTLLVVTMAALAVLTITLIIHIPDFSDSLTLQTELLAKVAQLEYALQQYDSQPSSVTQQVEIYTTQESSHSTDQSQNREEGTSYADKFNPDPRLNRHLER